MRVFAFLLLILPGCGLAWNTTVADHPQVRLAMISGVEPGRTTVTEFQTRWGKPTQTIRQGAQIAHVYRNMTNPPGFVFPQFGDSTQFVVVVYQYGIATGAYSSDIQGCRATFAPRPPGAAYPTPTTVRPVNCGLPPGADAGRDKGLWTMLQDAGGTPAEGRPAPPGPAGPPGVPADRYVSDGAGKYR